MLGKNLLIFSATHTPIYISFAAAVLLFVASRFIFTKKDCTFVCRIVFGALTVLFVALFVIFGIVTNWRFYGIADDWFNSRGAVLNIGFKSFFTKLSVPEKLFGTGYNSFKIYIL